MARGAWIAGAATLGAGVAVGFLLGRARPAASSKDEARSSVTDLIGNTPLIRINSLSDATGCEIYGKAEFMNPGGSIKDRVALQVSDPGVSHSASRGG